MEDLENPCLEHRIEVDQHVSATHQIKARVRRILGDIVPAEDAGALQLLADLKAFS